MPGQRRTLFALISSLLMIMAALPLQAAKPTWECRTAADGTSWECFKDGIPVAPEPPPPAPPVISRTPEQSVEEAPAPAVTAQEKPKETAKPTPAAEAEEPVIKPATKPARIAAPKPEPAKEPAVAEEAPVKAVEEPKPVPAAITTAIPAELQTGPRLDWGLNWDLCGPPPKGQPIPDSKSEAEAMDETTHITADAAEILRKEEAGTFSGNVEVTRGDKLVLADEIHYNNIDEVLDAQGNIYYQEPGLRITGSTGQFNLATNQGHMDDVEYRLTDRMARGNATLAEIEDKDRSHYQDISYTTCRPGNDSWLLQAGTMDLDKSTGRGEARNVTLAIKDVPVFYLPYISFPIDDRRKTGLLIPTVGQSEETGTDITIPYYLNLAPNYDATITPRIMSKRGLMLAGEFRYLTKNHYGEIRGEILPDDNDYPQDKNKTRGAFSIKEKGEIAPRLSLDVNINHVSDTEYLDDFGGSLSVSAARQLERRVAARYHGDHWSLLGRIQHFQSTDDTLTGNRRAYNRLPQIKLVLNKPNQLFGLTYHLDAEYVDFDRSAGVTGERIDIHPGLSLPMRRPWGFFTPKVTARYTRYRLEDEAAGNPDDPGRFLPTVSLDGGLFFERSANLFGTATTQTLEPRLFYLFIPHENQDDQPRFDTSRFGSNFNNLFRENRFNGADRVGDANHLTLALTSRILDEATGRELFKVNLGSIVYFEDREVQLGRSFVDNASTSSIIGEVSARITDHWHARANIQWDPHSHDHTERSALQLRYRDEEQRILNFAYRQTGDVSEQTDISGRWPLTSKISLVGRWYYSLEHNRTMEGFGGFEYDGCCYAVRAIARRYINDVEDEEDNIAVFLQLELKGLTSIGDDIVSFLGEEILGYPKEE